MTPNLIEVVNTHIKKLQTSLDQGTELESEYFEEVVRVLQMESNTYIVHKARWQALCYLSTGILLVSADKHTFNPEVINLAIKVIIDCDNSRFLVAFRDRTSKEAEKIQTYTGMVW